MKRYLSITVLFISVVSVYAQESNLQLWNQNKLEVKISERVSVGVNEKIHYQTETNEVRMKFGELFVKRQITEWFEAGLSGRLLWIKNENSWLQEYRPMIFGDLSAGHGRVVFELSNRFEYRMYKDLADHFRHRHMLSMEIPPVRTATWLKFYLAEEAYVRFDKERLHLARFHTGTKIRYCNFMEMKLFYVIEKSKKSTQWNTNDILGLNLNFTI